MINIKLVPTIYINKRSQRPIEASKQTVTLDNYVEKSGKNYNFL